MSSKSENVTNKLSWPYTILAIVLFLFFAGIVFSDFLGNAFLMTTDDNIGVLASSKSDLPHAFVGSWDNGTFLGVPTTLAISWTNLLKLLLPINFFSNWIHAIDLLLGSIFFILFLRERNIGFWGMLLGTLTALWLGTNFTLTYAGHIGKFGILGLTPVVLWSIEKYRQSNNWAWGGTVGGLLGLLFLEQIDVGLFFSIPLSCYMIFAIWQQEKAWLQVLKKLVPAAIVGLMILSFQVSTMRQNVLEDAVEKTPEEQWNFVTQWSFPPDEMIALIAPAYMGWRSGELEGPYWGRTGQTANWEQTHQGFRNFILENVYIGIIPVLLAVFACIGLITKTKNRSFVLFWLMVVAISLMLSFGRFFPLYSLIYKLPVIHDIRNPNKFLQIFQLALGILTATGIHELLATVKERENIDI